jgi:cytochrome c biogenesis protein CcmG, thiol:disulfide interchange protein DsbE
MPKRLPLPSRTALALAVAATVFLGCGDLAAAGDPGKLGTPLPKLALHTLDGKPFSLADHKGQVVVVDFWATWCGPCHIQARILEPIFRDYQGKGVKFFSVDLGEPPDRVKKFLAKKPLPYPTLLDPQDSAAERLQVYALPTVMILDKSGKIVFLQNSLVDGPTLRHALQTAGAPAVATR